MASPVSRATIFAMLPLMLLVALTTEGATRAWLELAAFSTLLLLLLRARSQ